MEANTSTNKIIQQRQQVQQIHQAYVRRIHDAMEEKTAFMSLAIISQLGSFAKHNAYFSV